MTGYIIPIVPNEEIGEIFKAKYDWYCMRVIPYTDTFVPFPKAIDRHIGIVFPYGGTLKEVKEYINSTTDSKVKKYLTWVPAEYVENYLNGK